jgi:hypothetical protein
MFVALAGLAGATPALARFVSQQTRNGAHYCQYIAPGQVHRPPSQARAAVNSTLVEVRIPIGARCSATLPAAAGREPPSIPLMAMLTREARIEGRRYCVYRYEGRDYSILAPPSGTCRLTPRP